MKKCPNCGTELKDTAKFCTNCKENLNTASQNNNNNSFLNTKNIVLILIGIIIVSAIAFFASSGLPQNIDTGVIDNDNNTTNNTVVVTNNSTVTEEPINDTKETEIKYVASSKTDKFHLTSCEWAEKINPHNLISFNSRESAIDSGRTPCEVCNP